MRSRGARRCCSGEGYPRELAGVTQGLNALLQSERNRISRYRDTLGNLAHGLKTPLAVIRASLGAPEGREQAAGAGAAPALTAAECAGQYSARDRPHGADRRAPAQARRRGRRRHAGTGARVECCRR